MPNLSRTFIAKFGLFLLFIFQAVDIQANTGILNNADSLFYSKNYQEALILYENLLEEEKSYSPAMLLKMAFISEGMGDYPKATLYLSKYYDHSPNPKVIAKIKELTNQSNLSGYTVSDQEQFFKLLTDNREKITLVLAFLLLVAIIVLVLNQKKQKKYISYLPALILVFLVFLSNNFLAGPDTGIITGSPALIMDRPTAGGNMIKKVDAGHRVIIKSGMDIWYEIEWENKKAFIKKGQVSKI